MSTRSRLISLAVLATAAAAPGAAQAATTCSYNSFNHLATVTTFASGDVASVARSGSAIQVNGVACGAATVTNTDLIEVSDASGGDSTLALDLSGGPLAPGFTAQFGDPSPTIKITYDGNDGNDTFEVFGSSQDDTIHLGASHVNLDVAADQNHADADVDLSEVETADINGGGGSDVIDATAHLDTGAAFSGMLYLEGALGDDTLTSGSGPGEISGGAGVNTVSYAEPSPGANTGVTVSLATQGVAQDTGTEGKDTLSGISGVIGSPFADTITGDGAANTIDAGDGPDTLFVRDGISDHADCGAGTDSVQSDVAGLDVLTGCEQVDFAPSADPGQPGGGPTGPGATADTTLTFRFTAKTRPRLGKHGIVKGSLLCPDEACTGEVSSKLTIGRIARRAAHKTTLVAAGRAKVVGLKLSARNLRRVRAALRHGTRVSLKITAIAHDAAGNRRTVTRTIRLRP